MKSSLTGAGVAASQVTQTTHQFIQGHAHTMWLFFLALDFKKPLYNVRLYAEKVKPSASETELF